VSARLNILPGVEAPPKNLASRVIILLGIETEPSNACGSPAAAAHDFSESA